MHITEAIDFSTEGQGKIFRHGGAICFDKRNPSLSAIRRRAKADNTNTYRSRPSTRHPSKHCGGNSARTQRCIGGGGTQERVLAYTPFARFRSAHRRPVVHRRVRVILCMCAEKSMKSKF